MKKILFFLFILFHVIANAQYNVRIVVTNIATRPNDDIYVSGNFNSWNPKDENYKLKPFGGSRKGVVIKDLPAGTYAFKFTRGDFGKVECTADGRDISDRVIDVTTDVVQECSIEGWKDDYPVKPKKYTASPQVKIMDTAFKIPQLNRTRRIWVYLPKGYATASKNYPVLYMQDGQNLFNEQTAFAGEWGVDECLDTLQKQTGKECIVVGIDNGGDKRINEYAPYDFTNNGNLIKAEGKQYVEFLVHTLKPYIDAKYRTQKSAEHTFIAGSSIGAVISMYAEMQYPQVFGGAGIFSPAFWAVPQLFDDAEKFNNANMHKFYFYCGGKEGVNTLADMNKMADIIERKTNYSVRRVNNPSGEHKEIYWREEFAEFYIWLMQ
jgi:metallo-beta-lactamase class B